VRPYFKNLAILHPKIHSSEFNNIRAQKKEKKICLAKCKNIGTVFIAVEGMGSWQVGQRKTLKTVKSGNFFGV
jgi:hypothetical protein